MNRKCIGCGVVLQSENEKEKGYVRKDKLDSAKYCERCFKINNYNMKSVTELKNINSYILDIVNKKAKYVYFMIDFLNINTETINTFKKINCPKTLIISKLDVIPKSIKCQKITAFLKEQYGINEKVIYQSSHKDTNTNIVVSNIKSSPVKEAYILGYTNAGKSTLINTLIEGKEKLTTSNNMNTTIDFMKVKIGDITIYDSPGFTYENTFYNKEEFELIKKSTPRSFLKPITHQTKDIANLIIENKMSIKTSNNNSITFYLSNDINIDKVFDNETKRLLNKPEIELKIDDNTDLIIKSLGFINIKKKTILKIRIDNKDILETRPSIFS